MDNCQPWTVDDAPCIFDQKTLLTMDNSVNCGYYFLAFKITFSPCHGQSTKYFSKKFLFFSHFVFTTFEVVLVRLIFHLHLFTTCNFLKELVIEIHFSNIPFSGFPFLLTFRKVK